jgi:hypothetical protein
MFTNQISALISGQSPIKIRGKDMKKTSIYSFKSASNILSKADIELIIDEYEITIVDCNKEKHSGSFNGFVLSCNTHNQNGMNRLYNKAMEIYSERIEAMGLERKNKCEEDNADLVEEALTNLKKYIQEMGE